VSTPDNREAAPYAYWEERTREIIYLMKSEVITLHNVASKMDEKFASPMRVLAAELEDHAEDLKAFLEKRRRIP
jgi:hypothetical protein